jgi:hypothetical protein
MSLDQALGQIRPLTVLIGKALIIAGLLKFFGVNVPINGSGLEIAVAGWLTQQI